MVSLDLFSGIKSVRCHYSKAQAGPIPDAERCHFLAESEDRRTSNLDLERTFLDADSSHLQTPGHFSWNSYFLPHSPLCPLVQFGGFDPFVPLPFPPMDGFTPPFPREAESLPLLFFVLLVEVPVVPAAQRQPLPGAVPSKVACFPSDSVAADDSIWNAEFPFFDDDTFQMNSDESLSQIDSEVQFINFFAQWGWKRRSI